jgi:NTP pyrophosphatase (non-canonical NTP hydrolase)
MSVDPKDFTLRDLENYVATLEAFFLAQSVNKDLEFRSFVQMTKIGEEYGEACEALIQLFNQQRAGKVIENPRGHLEDELADVVLATYNLAARLGLSVADGLVRKMAVLSERTGVPPMSAPASAAPSDKAS